MKFDVPVVLECLKRHSQVYTVRSWESKEEISVVNVKDVGFCTKEKICKVTDMRDLVTYVHHSGFQSAEEWWNKITEFKATDGWLYNVKLHPEEVFFKDVCQKVHCKEIYRCNLRVCGATDLCPVLEVSDLEKEESTYSPSIVTFTGNRNIKAKSVHDALVAVHKKYPDTTWRSGMAYGLGLAVAEFAYSHKIPFEAHLPFPSYIQVSKWEGECVHLHTKLLTKAVKVFTHSHDFSMAAYQDRNVKMAVGADVVVAFNKNASGGTVNMINYCKAQGIQVIDGFTLEEVA